MTTTKPDGEQGAPPRPPENSEAVQNEQAAPPPSASSPVPSDFGIPETEFTDSVRAAVGALVERTQRLRRELAVAHACLSDATRNADLDMLLPILNRRAFMRELSRFIAFAERYGARSCLIFFDLDDFKSVNDRFGHAAGDFVLAHFASMVSALVRNTDVVARLGGDEFGVILSHVTAERAMRKAMHLQRALEESPASWNGTIVVPRFSFGICELRAGESAEAVIARADGEMYLRKRSGR